MNQSGLLLPGVCVRFSKRQPLATPRNCAQTGSFAARVPNAPGLNRHGGLMTPLDLFGRARGKTASAVSMKEHPCGAFLIIK